MGKRIWKLSRVMLVFQRLILCSDFSDISSARRTKLGYNLITIYSLGKLVRIHCKLKEKN